MSEEKSLAERIFDGTEAEKDLCEKLDDAGAQFSKMRWDWYDNSLELDGVPNDFRLSSELQKVIFDAGFGQVYVNHQDKWETHYSGWGKEFKSVEGWRVSYPHKREELKLHNDDGKIWVEKVVPSWPKDSFSTGYAVVKPSEDTQEKE